VNVFIQGCYHYVSTIAENCTFAGIVTFDSTASIDHDLVGMTGANRDSLISAIPTSATGGTGIGAG
jgi:calcium-activated chloride channel regulator 1/calcium-activated chloride channel regulator 4